MVTIRGLALHDDETEVADDPAWVALAKVNFFVGPNNVGKSRLLRRLFARADLSYVPASPDLDQLNRLAADFRRDVSQTLAAGNLGDLGGLKRRVDSLKPIAAFSARSDVLAPFREALDVALQLTPSAPVTRGGGQLRATVEQMAGHLVKLGCRYRARYEEVIGDWQHRPLTRVYVPALRGVRVLAAAQDVYGERTAGDYFAGLDDMLSGELASIFTGQSLSSRVRGMTLAERGLRDELRDFAQLLGDRFFHEPVELSPREDGTLCLQRGDGREDAIHDVGDGIQQLLTILFPLFFHRQKPLLLFIEEPELFLHPQWQRALLEVFSGDVFPNAQIFATTHSNHLLDRSIAGSGVAQFLVAPRVDGAAIRVEPVLAADARILEVLGARISSVFLTNCTVWIEGISDRIYFRRYFELLAAEGGGPPLLEDVHYSFFEYAGSNLEHWQEIESSDAAIDARRVTARMIVVADRDTGKSAKHARLAERLGARYVVLPCREVENLLAPHVLHGVVASYETRPDLVRMPADDYSDALLGDYIDAKMLSDARESRRFRSAAPVRDDATPRVYAETSGTIKEKVDFALRAVRLMTSARDLSARAVEVTSTLCRFVAAQNGRPDA